jgi:hypothetical protein
MISSTTRWARSNSGMSRVFSPFGKRGLADLEAMSADIFESDEELDEFLAFTYAERRRDVA